MKYLVSLRYVLVLLYAFQSLAQCGDSQVCNGNTGLYSNDDATSIAYDNMGSAYHATYIKEPDSGWRVWGANMSNTGGNLLSPASVNSTTYPALTGTIYKLALGSDYTDQQLIVLTSTGLFAIGDSGDVISTAITTSTNFHKITVNGKADGLPTGVGPADVKMLFASTYTLMITTCTGNVWVLSQTSGVRGNGGGGSASLWAQVMENATTPLSNVIVSRGNSSMGFALKSDGTLWTWGSGTYLGDNTTAITRNFATQMTLPAGIPGIKMIQATSDGGFMSYYVLGTDKKVYALGENQYGQLGDRTIVDRTAWVNAKNPDNSIITDAAWISANEHDENYAGYSIIRAGGVFYTAGYNSYYMVGRINENGTNYLDLPGGINASDVITHAEVGGHSTAVIKLGSPRYGYCGHRINGSMGDGSSLDESQETFDFITPPIVAVCGTICVQPVLSGNGPLCPGGNAVFTITGTPGDIISYSLNSGSTQTIAIGTDGTVAITSNNATADQHIALSYILGGTGSCSNGLSLSATVIVSDNVTPAFVQVPPICVGDPLAPLPVTSTNGITGTWAPAINNQATTTYTFTPTSSDCALTATMTINVNPVNTQATFTQVAAICSGESLVLPSVSNNGIAGTWAPAINNLATTTYTFTPTTLGACIPTTTMTVQVIPATVPQFTQVAAVCQGDVISPLPTVSENSIPGSWSPVIDNSQTTTYTFTPQPGNCASSVQMTITVNPKIIPAFAQLAPICEGTPAPGLPTMSTNGINGVWSPAFSNTATATYTFTPAVGECAFTTSMTVVVNPKITPQFTTPDPVCYADPGFTLPAVSDNGVSGTWSPAFSNTQSATYSFTPNGNECAFPATLPIQVYEDFDFDYTEYCREGNLLLEIVPVSGSFNIGTAGFIWTSGATVVGSNSIFDVTSYLNSTPETETLPVTFGITVTNANGCPKTKSIQLDNIFCGIQKGISPNNDSQNEFFDLRLLNVEHLSIFNRYGVKVYSKSNYYNEWHGQTDNGTQLPDATYYYRIDLEDGTIKTGWIYINTEK